jgi:hypothetical protein
MANIFRSSEYHLSKIIAILSLKSQAGERGNLIPLLQVSGAEHREGQQQ